MYSKSWKLLIPPLVVGIILLIVFSTLSGSYNRMVKLEEDVASAWSQVQNVYQRRYDLIPNLVETVKGAAAYEKDTLTALIEARSRVGGVMEVTEEVLNNPDTFKSFQRAQGELSNALQRLMVVVEDYPELKANQNFLALQDQLEGSENRIAVERRRFNEATRKFNTYIKQFPRIILARMVGFEAKNYFEALPEAEQAVKVQF